MLGPVLPGGPSAADAAGIGCTDSKMFIDPLFSYYWRVATYQKTWTLETLLYR
jgi:hypothetical protein